MADKWTSTRPWASVWKVKVTQSCPTLCNPMDYTVHGILQARILEWVAFPFSRASSQPRDRTQVSFIADRLLAEPQGKPKNTGVGSLSIFQWALGHRLNSCSTLIQWLWGMWDLPGSGIKPISPALAGGFFTSEPPGKTKTVLFF